jgi:hypothetical protein
VGNRARLLIEPIAAVMSAKAKKPTKLATTDKKKTKSVAIKKEKMTKLETR